MEYPTFYDKVEKIILKDELSEFLGATKDGIIEITYLDCVKLAGHSCPTVASSYILANEAIKYLCKKDIPLRSSLKIEFKESKESGVNGVIANILTLILGSFDSGGFSGIGTRFKKRDLLFFNNKNQKGSIKFTNIYTNEFIECNIDTSVVPANKQMQELMQKALLKVASDEEIEQFKKMWQSRVENMLLNKELWSKIVKIVNKG